MARRTGDGRAGEMALKLLQVLQGRASAPMNDVFRTLKVLGDLLGGEAQEV